MARRQCECMSQERLQKILARAGLGSRRACERLITGKHVTVDGRLITELGTSVDARASAICVDGQPIHTEVLRYVILNKPVGYLSNPDQRAIHPSWTELVHVPERLFPVGRLDLDSEGLMLLTNDGELALHLTHPRFEYPKTYLVEVVGIPDARKLRRLEHGIMLDDGPTAPARVTRLRDAPPQAFPRTAPATRPGVERRSSWLKVVLRRTQATGATYGRPAGPPCTPAYPDRDWTARIGSASGGEVARSPAY
jgi:23S rRNA pseudouridine2605 synthase